MNRKRFQDQRGRRTLAFVLYTVRVQLPDGELQVIASSPDWETAITQARQHHKEHGWHTWVFRGSAELVLELDRQQRAFAGGAR
jgi:hypothetical protein